MYRYAVSPPPAPPAGPPSDSILELIIVGSGCSAAVPDIVCMTGDLRMGCACCLASKTPEGKENNRGNTGAIVRVPQPDGTEATILIDCGKTFRERALSVFPKKGLRKIDACILTHHHADAIDGLDDLRAWTYQSAIEKTIPIYCTRATYDFIAKGFEYLTSKKAASGGGAVPSFDWRIFDDRQPLQICGLRITPLPVHHGIYMDSPAREPLISLGFLINSEVLYLSDVSYIPEETWARIGEEVSLPDQGGRYVNTHLPQLQALVIDGGSLRLGPSHFGLPQAIGTSRRLGAKRTYLTDFPHGVSQACWLHFCTEFEKGRTAASTQALRQAPPLWRVWGENEAQPPYAQVYNGFNPLDEDYEVFTERALEAIQAWAGGVLPTCWLRTAVDGMTISWTANEMRGWQYMRVWDDVYHQ